MCLKINKKTICIFFFQVQTEHRSNFALNLLPKHDVKKMQFLTVAHDGESFFFLILFYFNSYYSLKAFNGFNFDLYDFGITNSNK